MEEYFRQLANFFSLSETACEKVGPAATVRHMKKGELLLRPDEKPAEVFVLQTGILRCFVLNPVGEDVTDSFLFRYGEVFAGRLDFFTVPEDSLGANAEAMAETSVIRLELSKLLPVIRGEPELMELFCRLLTESYCGQMAHKYALYRQDAEARYRWFLENYPGLIDRVTHGHIASFLGITPVTLSRMRKKLKEETAAEVPEST